MLRVLGTFGFAGAFVMISGDLRQAALEGIGMAVSFAQKYSPYSYVVVALLVLDGVSRTLRTD
jgi:hypothetical protein